MLLEDIEQAPLCESHIINRDYSSVSHDNPMPCTIQFSNSSGGCHIAASGFIIVWKYVRDGDNEFILMGNFFHITYDIMSLEAEK